jgi:hypothetical protein
MAGMRNTYFVSAALSGADPLSGAAPLRLAAPDAESNASEWDGFGAYVFEGHGAFISGECISAAERDRLWADVWAALWEMDGRRTDVRGVLDRQLQKRLETQLRAVLHRVFVPHSTPRWEKNQPLQTEEGWASAFHVARMIPEDYEYVHENEEIHTIRRVGVWLDGGGNAQARVIFGWHPDRAPSPECIQIRYSGRLRFGTFHRSKESLTRDY